jgi:16S rRNA (cytosine1402-N4)-methyltransferase
MDESERVLLDEGSPHGEWPMDGRFPFPFNPPLVLRSINVTQVFTTYATDYHVPVLVHEVLEYLDVQPGGLYVDGTLGGGGHTQAILDACAPDGRVVAFDRDPNAIATATQRLSAYADRLTIVHANYATAHAHVSQADGWLVDAGVSSHQLDDAERGFSFQRPGPLDMRMGDGPTLADYLADVEEEELARVLREYGEVKGAGRLARAILFDFQQGRFKDTRDLGDMIERVLGRGAGSGRHTRIHPATLVFQALRIAVNDELTGLETAVLSIPQVVKKGGRAVFISFHSLEDRIVKNGFRTLAGAVDDAPRGLPVERPQPKVEILTRKPVVASEEELSFNPRARSAKLRAVRVL